MTPPAPNLLSPLLLLVSILSDPAATDETLFELSIIHINDIHSHFEQVKPPTGSRCHEGEEDKCVGGIARLVAKTKELLEAKPDSLLLNAGDNYQGTLWYTFYGWEVVAEFLNRLPWTAIALGNHEFDRKLSGLVPCIKALKAPVICANMDASKEPSMQGIFQTSIVVERGGRKVGIIGIVTTEVKTISSPENLEFLPEAEAVAKEGARLKDEGVEIIVVLSHSGIHVELQLAETDPYVDVIVGGHTHSLLYTGSAPDGLRPIRKYPIIVTQDSGRKVAVVQAYCNSMILGNLTAFFDEEGKLVSAEGSAIYLDNSVVPDPDTVVAMAPWAKKIKEMGRKKIGNTAVLLEQAIGVCRKGECNLGSFVADAMAHSFAGRGGDGAWTRAAIAITNSGGLRQPISAGVVTYDDLVATLPFGNPIIYLEMPGTGLRKAIEHAVSTVKTYYDMGRISTSFRKLLQVSGLHIEYYEACNSSNTEKIRSIKVLCHKCDVPIYEPLKDDEWYPMAINSYVAEGGDEFYMFQKDGRNKQMGDVDTAVVMNYFEKMDPVVQSRDGRITFVENPQCNSNPNPSATPTSASSKTV